MTRDADPVTNPANLANPEAAGEKVRLRFLYRATMPLPDKPGVARLFRAGLLIDLPEAAAADFIARGLAVRDDRPDAPASFEKGWQRGLGKPPREIEERRREAQRAAAKADARRILEARRKMLTEAGKETQRKRIEDMQRGVWRDPQSLDSEATAALLDRAETDREAFEAAKGVGTVRLLVHGGDMPAALARFMGEVLLGWRKPPGKGGRLPKPEWRDRELAEVVAYIVAHHDLAPTRNDASDHRDSACDLVAEAMAAQRLQPATYDEIEAAWHRHKDGCIVWP